MPQITMTMTRSEWEREQLAALRERRAHRHPITEADASADLQRRLIEAAPLVNARAAQVRAARATPLPPERVWLPPRVAPGAPPRQAREVIEEEEDTTPEDLVTQLEQAAPRPRERREETPKPAKASTPARPKRPRPPAPAPREVIAAPPRPAPPPPPAPSPAPTTAIPAATELALRRLAAEGVPPKILAKVYGVRLADVRLLLAGGV